ncbi:MAG TPA: hypothetical protein TECP_00684 [Hyphomicrobiaceae bacterium MAG_BT-2024]
MVAVKSTQVLSFIANLPSKCRAVLIYGVDLGLISECIEILCSHIINHNKQKTEIIRVDESDLERAPEKLLLELRTFSMFGEKKIVRTSLNRRVSTAHIKHILNMEHSESFFILDGGDLKSSDPVRKLFEASQTSAALPCFPDTHRDLNLLIDEVISGEGYVISRDAKQALCDRLGQDRAQSRREIEKLILYTANDKHITLKDVLIATDDVSSIVLDKIINYISMGDFRKASYEFGRSFSSGDNLQVVLSVLNRHFKRLYYIKEIIDSGKSFEEATRSLRPPIFYKNRDTIAMLCKSWTSEQIKDALTFIFETTKLSRQNPDLEFALTERLVLKLANMSANAIHCRAK